MTRVHHLSAVIGLVVVALGAGAPWWTVTLLNGGTITVTGVDSSALLWSVGAVCVAAYGLQFAMNGIPRRIVAGVQVIASFSFSAVAWGSAGDPLPSALSGITSLTGVSGVGAQELVATLTVTGWHVSAVVAGAFMLVSGLFGAIRAERVTLASRFERGAASDVPQDSVSAWDALSDGSDPTRG
jgi:uncharacterized membrane protein (TIGR02234 family)